MILPAMHNLLTLRNLVVLACVALLSTSTAYAQNKQLKKVEFASTYSPPYMIDPANVEAPGISIEIVREVFLNTKISPDITFFPWARAELMAKKGSVTGAFNCAFTKARENFFYFSEPINGGDFGIVTRGDYKGPEINSLQNIGSTVGVVRGYNLEKNLKASNIAIFQLNSVRQALRVLSADRVQYVYTYEGVFIHETSILKSQDKFKFHRTGSTKFGVCFSRKSEGVENTLKIFNENLKRLKKSGRFDEILSKYNLK